MSKYAEAALVLFAALLWILATGDWLIIAVGVIGAAAAVTQRQAAR